MAIDSLAQLSIASGIPANIIASLIFEHQGRYRKHFISKRDGGVRTISAPLPALLQIQRAINREILSNVALHDCAVGFRKHHSILDHVRPHTKNRIFAKFDIKDCFGSIKSDGIFNLYLRATGDKSLSKSLTELSVDEGKLPQGAATSPMLCNIVLRPLDERIHGLCQKLGLIYTRYADDLLVSGENLNLYIYKSIKSYIEESGFQPNEKSRLMENPQRLIVCGISVSRDGLKVPKQKRRSIRQETYFLLRNSILDESMMDNIFDPFHADRLMGRLHFWHFVEPSAAFPLKYIPIIKEKILAEIGI